jgi:hypothetical protein
VRALVTENIRNLLPILQRIVASLCTPVLQTVEQVAVGDLVQVRADSEPLRRNKSVSHNAKITAVHSDGSVDVLFTVDEVISPCALL